MTASPGAAAPVPLAPAGAPLPETVLVDGAEAGVALGVPGIGPVIAPAVGQVAAGLYGAIAKLFRGKRKPTPKP